MSTLDFELEIGPGTGDTYPVVARAPGGEVPARMRFPVPLAELDRLLVVIRDAVLASSAVTRRLPTGDEHPVRQLGRRLFEALVADDVRGLYVASSQRARERGGTLRLVLRVRPPELARLPWEFLFDPGQQDYLGLSMPLVRYPEVLAPRQPLQVEPPLRILGMSARPEDLHPLGADTEQHRLRGALADPQREALVELGWVAGQTYGDLEAAMDRGPWHVLHIVGHGGYDRAVEEGTLALTDERGRTDRVGAEDLSRLLADHHTLRLIVLNACDTARAGSADAFSSTAAALMRRGIPAVVAMQFEISDTAAIRFAQTFYQNVAKRLPVDIGVMRARRALRLAKKDTLEWGTPVLYLRAADARIFAAGGARSWPSGSVAGHAAAAEVGELYDRALAAFWTEQWEHAAALLGQVLTRRPDHPDAAVKLEQAQRHRLVRRYRQGLHLLEVGSWQQAVDVLEQLDPGYQDTAALLARARRELAAPPAPALRHLEVVRTVRHDEAVNAVVFSSDGHRLATASDDRTARIWDVTSGAQLVRLPHDHVVRAVAFSRGGRLVTASEGRAARVWASGSAAQLAVVAHDFLWGVALSPDGCRLATTSHDRTARIWDVTSGAQLVSLAHDDAVRGVVFSGDGRLLATASDDRTARVWDVTSGAHLVTFPHDGAVRGVVFSADGRWLATASGTGTVRLWEVAGAALRATFTQDDAVRGVALSPHGQWLATAGADGTARVWDAGGAAQLAHATHDGPVEGVAFSPCGHLLATAGRDRTARIWAWNEEGDDE